MSRIIINSMLLVASIVSVLVASACQSLPESRRRAPITDRIEPIVMSKTPIFTVTEPTAGRAVLKQARRVFPVTNVALPDGRVWRPRRHFGPFISGSDLSLIQVWMHNADITWYHNDYFVNNNDNSIYQLYYNAILWPPQEQTPAPDSLQRLQVPGTLPQNCPVTLQPQPCSFANDVLFTLNSIHYSSRYGGSIRLLFHAEEDNEVDLRYSNFAWDLRDLALSLYIKPYKEWLNKAGATQPSSAQFFIEFKYDNAIQYELSSAGIEKVVPLNKSTLQEALEQLGQRFKQLKHDGKFGSAVRFVHGFFHSQHQDMIGPNDLVDALDIGDNRANIWTHVREAKFTLQIQAGNITAPGYNPLESDYDYTLDISTRHAYNIDGNVITVDLPTDIIKLTGTESGPWREYGQWRADECSALIGVNFVYTLTESTDILGNTMNRYFDSMNSWIPLTDCTAINDAVSGGRSGIIQEWVETHEVTESDEPQGTMTTRFRIIVYYR